MLSELLPFELNLVHDNILLFNQPFWDVLMFSDSGSNLNQFLKLDFFESVEVFVLFAKLLLELKNYLSEGFSVFDAWFVQELFTSCFESDARKVELICLQKHFCVKIVFFAFPPNFWRNCLNIRNV